MTKFRIIKETYDSGRVVFRIQRRHWLLPFLWINTQELVQEDYFDAEYKSLEEARRDKAMFERPVSKVPHREAVE